MNRKIETEGEQGRTQRGSSGQQRLLPSVSACMHPGLVCEDDVAGRLGRRAGLCMHL